LTNLVIANRKVLSLHRKSKPRVVSRINALFQWQSATQPITICVNRSQIGIEWVLFKQFGEEGTARSRVTAANLRKFCQRQEQLTSPDNQLIVIAGSQLGELNYQALSISLEVLSLLFTLIQT
jgi:hypothetical protein